jgi:hypothetical protein
VNDDYIVRVDGLLVCALGRIDKLGFNALKAGYSDVRLDKWHVLCDGFSHNLKKPP